MKAAIVFAAASWFAAAAAAQEAVPCGAGSFAPRPPLRLARSSRNPGGDQSRAMQTRPLFLTARRQGEPLPTNDWWTDALVSRWTGDLWPYPAKVRIGPDGVRVAFPSRWNDDGTAMEARSSLVVRAAGAFSPEAAFVDDWHDFDVEILLPDTAASSSLRTTLVHGSPFVWVESEGVELDIAPGDAPAAGPATRRGHGEILSVGGDLYGLWRGPSAKGGEWAAIASLPSGEAFDLLDPYAAAIVRSTRVDWRYDMGRAEVVSTWSVETEDLSGGRPSPAALQGFLPHHLKRTSPGFACIEGLRWPTPRGVLRAAAGNSLSISQPFHGLLPYWPAPAAETPPTGPGAYDPALFRDLLSDYAARGTFGDDTYWGGKGLLQMAFAMAGALETGDTATFSLARARLAACLGDWLTWTPGEESRFFYAVPRWGGLVGVGSSYGSETFNDHHFHYGYFAYAGALLCLADPGFRDRHGPMLRLLARDYANWERPARPAPGGAAPAAEGPFFRTFDPWAGHSFAGGLGDAAGNGQESSSEAMQGWGGLFLLGLALGDDAMRDAAIFGYVSEARATAEYWFDRDRENIDRSRFRHPYNSNLTCHGVGWWTYFSGDPAWMHAIQWLPDTPALDYLSEDLAFAKWDWETMWAAKEVGGWFEKGRDRAGNETPPVGGESLGNVFLSYLRRHDPAQAAGIFARLRQRGMRAATAPDTAHMAYWAIHSQLAWGAPDFSVTADFPCARAFVRGGVRSFVAYNPGDTLRAVTFFGENGAPLCTLDAPPRRLAAWRDGAPVPVKTPDPAAIPAAPEAWEAPGGKKFVEDEEIGPAALEFASRLFHATPSAEIRLGLSLLDQFGDPLPSDGAEYAVEALDDGEADDGLDYELRPGGIFVPFRAGAFRIRATLGPLAAETAIDASDRP